MNTTHLKKIADDMFSRSGQLHQLIDQANEMTQNGTLTGEQLANAERGFQGFEEVDDTFDWATWDAHVATVENAIGI